MLEVLNGEKLLMCFLSHITFMLSSNIPYNNLLERWPKKVLPQASMQIKKDPLLNTCIIRMLMLTLNISYM